MSDELPRAGGDLLWEMPVALARVGRQHTGYGRNEKPAVTGMLKYEASLDYPEYALHEEIRLRIRLNNCGTSAIVLADPSQYPSPQPTYRLFGPDSPEGRTFTLQSAFPNADPSRFPLKQIQIEPGGMWSGSVLLTLMSSMAAVGEYRLESQL